MEGTGWTRAAVTLGVLTVAALVVTFKDHNYVGGPIVAAVFGLAALRCWRLGG